MKSDRLKGKIRERHMSYSKCAKALNISTATFNSKINGNTKFYVEEANTLGTLLDMTEVEVFEVFFSVEERK
jgi:plasmid maintenance system antidote protein VapI